MIVDLLRSIQKMSITCIKYINESHQIKCVLPINAQIYSLSSSKKFTCHLPIAPQLRMELHAMSHPHGINFPGPRGLAVDSYKRTVSRKQYFFVIINYLHFLQSSNSSSIMISDTQDEMCIIDTPFRTEHSEVLGLVVGFHVKCCLCTNKLLQLMEVWLMKVKKSLEFCPVQQPFKE